MADSQVSVGGSLAYAWRLWLGGWRSIWGALALSSLAATVAGAGALAGKLEIWAVGFGAGLVTAVIVQGSVFRLAFVDLHGDDPAFRPGNLGIQWRSMEWKLLAAGALQLLLMALLGVLCAIPVAATAIGILIAKGVQPSATLTAETLAAGLGNDGMAAVGLVFLFTWSVFIVLIIRLSLVQAMTAESGRVSVLRSWPVTRNNVAGLFLTTILISLPMAGLQRIIPEMVSEVTTMGITPSPRFPAGPAIVAGGLVGILSAAVFEPLLLAAMAYYYRNLKAPESKAP